MAANGRILTKDLDERLRVVEEKIGEMADHVTRLGEQLIQAAQAPAPVVQVHAQAYEGNGFSREEPAEEGKPEEGKIAELEAQLSRLDERIEKIAQTVVAARWS
jgi:TolA-binding protein